MSTTQENRENSNSATDDDDDDDDDAMLLTSAGFVITLIVSFVDVDSVSVADAEVFAVVSVGATQNCVEWSSSQTTATAVLLKRPPPLSPLYVAR